MTPITTQDVWIQTKKKVSHDNGIFVIQDDLVLEKNSNMVCLSREDFEKIIGDAFDAGRESFAYEIGEYFEPEEIIYRNKTEYINSIITNK